MEITRGYYGSILHEWSQDDLSVSLLTYSPGQTQPPHAHLNPTLFVVLDGLHRDVSDAGPVDQECSTLLFRTSMSRHYAEISPRGVAGLGIEFGQAWLDRNGIAAATLGRYRLEHSALALLATYRIALDRGVWAEKPEELTTSILELASSLAPESRGESSMPNWLVTAHDAIVAGFRDPTRLAQIARTVSIDPVHLARTYRRFFGCTIGDQVSRLRLLEATRLVIQGASISNAAVAAGFYDHAHYARTFRGWYRRPPIALAALRKSMSGTSHF